MSQVVERAIKKSPLLGASEIEAHYSVSREILVKIEANEVSDATWRINRSLSIAVISNRRLGFSHTTDVSTESIGRIVEKAYRLSLSCRENPMWRSVPSPKPFPSVRGILDERIVSSGPEDVVRLAEEMLKEAKSDPRISVANGLVSLVHGEVHVANSAGVLGSDEGTFMSTDILALAKGDGEVGSFVFEWDASRSLNIDPAEIGRKAALKAVESLDAKPVGSFTGTLILDYDVVIDLLSTLAEALDGESVWRGSSPLRDKVGESVASDSLTLIDDGTLEASFSTSRFDYEGVPRRRTVLIENGVLKRFLHNSYTAGILNAESTGNASGFLSVAPSNLIVIPGDWSEDEMVREVKLGILVKRFSGHMGFQDGVVSGSVKQAFLVESGELKHPVKECMISGNLYDFLKRIRGLGDKTVRKGSFIVPKMMIENVHVIGK
ncbi:MAG: TldD/PmbA family protein [Thermoproteota archaeon]